MSKQMKAIVCIDNQTNMNMSYADIGKLSGDFATNSDAEKFYNFKGIDSNQVQITFSQKLDSSHKCIT